MVFCCEPLPYINFTLCLNTTGESGFSVGAGTPIAQLCPCASRDGIWSWLWTGMRRAQVSWDCYSTRVEITLAVLYGGGNQLRGYWAFKGGLVMRFFKPLVCYWLSAKCLARCTDMCLDSLQGLHCPALRCTHVRAASCRDGLRTIRGLQEELYSRHVSISTRSRF